MPRDALERDDLLAGRARQLFLGFVELALAVEQLAVALLEHLRALVELLVALTSRRSCAVSSLRRARASSSASRPSRSFSSLASRMSSFWRARASASMRRASALAAFMPWDAHMLRASAPSTAPPTAATRATATRVGVSIDSPPIRTGLCGRTRHVYVGSLATEEETVHRACGVATDRRSQGPGPRWAAIGPLQMSGTPLTIGAWNVPVA